MPRAEGRRRTSGTGTAARGRRTPDRLRRLLLVVPYVVRHPGTRLSELARLFDAPQDELVQDLGTLLVSGLPPYSPGDLVDVTIEDGRVWIAMADFFSRPVRLTRAEAVPLYLRATALLGTGGLPESDAIAGALEKLERGLGDELGALAGRVDVAEGGGGGAADTVAALRRAAARSERVRIEYYGANRDEVTARTIEPEQVFAAIGNWYAVAWDTDADGERLFRADRVRSVEPTGERFTPRGLAGAGRPLYSRTEEDIEVRLRLRPSARWVAEYYEAEVLSDGPRGLEVALPTKDLAWVAKLLLRLGGAAEVLAPGELRDEALRLAEETLRGYA